MYLYTGNYMLAISWGTLGTAMMHRKNFNLILRNIYKLIYIHVGIKELQYAAVSNAFYETGICGSETLILAKL